MASRCDRCGKGILRGKKIAAARQGLNYRSPRIFRPNLQTLKIIVNGRKKKLTLCTKCLRRVKKEQEELRKRQEELKARLEAKRVKKKKIEKPKKLTKKKRLPRKQAREKRKEEKKEKEKRKAKAS
jgi:large subunit ribosomal protein L28